MLGISQGSVILSLTLGYILVRLLGETKRLAHIPTIGYSDPILSYFSALRFQFDPEGFLRRGWAKIEPGTTFVKVPGVTRWVVVGATAQQYKNIVRLPDRTMSSVAAFEENLHADSTLFQREISDQLQIPVIVNKLNRSLGELVPEIHDEAIAAFEDSFPLDGDEWKSFMLSPEVMKIIGRVSNRVLVGLPLCRNMDYIMTNVSYAIEVVVMTYLLTAIPKFLRPWFDQLFSPVPKRVKQISSYVQPLINARREGMAKLGESFEKPLDFLTWLIDAADEHHKPEPDRDVVLRMMVINFGSIHTTSLTITNAIFTLVANPEHIEPLRAEVEKCIEEEGWTKAAMDKMHLLDMFIKESQRCDVMQALGGHRMTVEDCTLSGTFIPEGTMLAANVLNSHRDTSAWGSNSAEFDPSRFVNIEKETGRKFTVVTTSPNIVTFGHGRHACPGRFFAAQEMKLLISYLLLTYDIKLDSENGPNRPKNMWIGLNCMPNPNGKIMLKRRAKTAA